MRLGTLGLLFAALTIAACATPERAEGEPNGVRGVAVSAADATRGVAARAGSTVSDGVSGAWSKLKTPEDSVVADPFEPFNRAMYKFNDGLDRVLLGPAANVYSTVVPQVGRNRVRDFIDNWKHPVWFANDVLQGDFNHAGVTAQRFALNTTVGVLGVYDYAANHADLPKRDEDFGQTLGTYGVANGPYLMLPVLGPTTFRDLTGKIVDVAMDPITYAEFDGDDAYRITTRTLDVVDIRVQTDPVIETIRESVDPYTQARALYIQNRNARIRNGDGDYEELPDF